MVPRANALGLIIRDGSFLLEEQKGKHSNGDGYFYRPIGGTIELGEWSEETLKREFVEELGVSIRIRRYLSCMENIYRIEGKIGHEITQMYLVEFEDERHYAQEIFAVAEGDRVTHAKWIPKAELLTGELVLYPEGLIDLIAVEF
ncbi:NUDIX hydrolase [Planococcus lenghuensis]|uniref:DNA mismatch repair protein MutT n=1 Tax=Planococcus lenghuensis TaxID=2213202 RepID=A0A1Q2KWM2_9BACL|nr:NUDIX hydrolase [Planococcus lenghuensis]AQQ52591.1 DNA mismatch repair protein MutT [Planococcus lenghuensis]